ncbi:MAG: cell division protein SepF [Clostridia bacterium]|nr:cell division protein SepF [Clostridia bacterium]
MSGIIEKFKEMWSPADEEYDEEYDEQIIEEGKDSCSSNHKNNRVVSIRSSSKMKVVLTKPECFGDEIRNIADEYLKVRIIVLNLEDVVKAESRRIIDFLSGVAYAHGGKIKRVATDTFVMTPKNVELEGEAIINDLENQGVHF